MNANGLVSFCVFSVSVAVFAAKPVWSRPDLVDKANRGEIQEANVSWWGYNPTNSTTYLKAALRSKVRKLTLDRQAGPWYTLPLWGRSDLTLNVPEGVELCAVRGQYHKIGDRLITFSYATNVTLTGGGTLRMWFEDYTNKALYAWSEWRHAVTFQSCHNILIENLCIADSGGDGIYFGQLGRIAANTDVTIRNVTLRRNNRQGISVISADRMLIENCVMEDTCGTPPMAGIDFEPNGAHEVLRNITMRNCIARNNKGSGFDFSVCNLNAMSPEISITLENCRSEGNRDSLKFHRASDALTRFRGDVVFRGCTFNDKDIRRDAFRSKTGKETMSVRFEDCLAADPEKGGKLTPLGPEFGWGRLETPKWPDGSPIRLEETPFPDPLKVTVRDSAPGSMVKLMPVHLRGAAAYMVYADSVRKVRLKVKMRPVGRSKLQYCEFKVHSREGKKIATINLDPVFLKEQEIAFEVPAPGFYRVSGQVRFSHMIVLTESDAPVAAIYSAESGLPNWSSLPGEACLRVPSGTPRFAVSAAGGGGNELLHARLVSPDGRCVWDVDNVDTMQYWMSPEHPQPGIWRLSSLTATKGCMDDYSFAIFGVPYQLFLTPEKTW
jgi:hypothetical protein